MATTLNQIVSDIRNIATSGSNSVSFRIEDKQIEFWVHEIRSKLIAQELQKRRDITDTWLQQINCLHLIEVDKSECCEVETNCKILRTVRQLPQTIDYIGDNLIIRVESLNGDIISKTTAFESKYNDYNKYTSNKPKWFLKNNYIYIINTDYIDKINTIGLFENPTELQSFTSCNGNTCYNKSSQYPVSAKMASDITDIIVKTKVFPYLQMPEDNSNNAKNELIQGTKLSKQEE